MTETQEASGKISSPNLRAAYVNDACEHLDKQHHAKGMCQSCYNREYFRNRGMVYQPRNYRKDRSCRHQVEGICVRCYQAKWAYGVDFGEMWDRQGGRCASCNNSFACYSDAKVDHNHRTNLARGLLCHTCNVIVGFIENERYEAALAYLKSYEDG